MNTADLYTYLGYAVIIILIIMIINTIIGRNTKKEGFLGIFTDSGESSNDEKEDETAQQISKNLKSIQDSTSQITKQMNLDKNREKWEKLIVAMEDKIDVVSLQSVSILADMIEKDPNNSKIVSVIDKLNSFSEYKKTLKENMTYLDSLQ
tara:strand:- start:274 stop:723 length:450 start_codon:yes stop_codon:yes gene_type:complete